jgi:Ni2+-binding GTPase involved in maturation of urease and hydrogenase
MGDTRPVIVPLGGFLGAGKTTLILAASRVVRSRGMRAAAILNDQGSELVDTQHVAAEGIAADQVTGGCFCCRFSDLVDAAERLRAHGPDVIFTEAVGSCTDISATTLQPLKRHYGHRVRLAPYTVLVDPQRAREFTAADRGADLPFLFQTQLEEADLICFTKSDLYPEYPAIGGAPIRYLSAVTAQGVAEWLDEVLAGHILPGGRILEIDYERYAKAEAALAWLNASGTVTVTTPLSPSSLIGPLLDELDRAMAAAHLRIVHLKLSDDAPTGFVKASIVDHGQEPQVSGMLSASPASAHELLLNIRAEGDATALQRVVETQLQKLPGTWASRTMQCFCPAPPTPQHRMASVAGGGDV